MTKKPLPRRLLQLLGDSCKASCDIAVAASLEDVLVAARRFARAHAALRNYLFKNLKPEVLEEKSDNGG